MSYCPYTDHNAGKTSNSRKDSPTPRRRHYYVVVSRHIDVGQGPPKQMLNVPFNVLGGTGLSQNVRWQTRRQKRLGVGSPPRVLCLSKDSHATCGFQFVSSAKSSCRALCERIIVPVHGP